MKGQKLGDGLRQTLSTAYPSYAVDVQISDSLVLRNDEYGFYQSLEQFADITNQVSISMYGSGAFMANVQYSGVQITTKGKTITVRDGTVQSPPTTILFQDLIGQPTWIDLQTIQVKTIMRGDISVCDMVTLPLTITTTTAGSNPQLRDNSVFQGTFMVQKIRHVGNFRQPDGMSWNTTLDLIAPNSPGAERGLGQTIGAPGTTPTGFVAGRTNDSSPRPRNRAPAPHWQRARRGPADGGRRAAEPAGL